MIRIDVLVIGGGLQGLVLLHHLSESGYSCALVSDTDLGGGQTLHSHGVLNTGFGFENAWPNADAALEIVDALVPPGRSRQPSIPGAGVGVRVGLMREDEPDIRWMKWAEVAESEAVIDR